MNDTCDPPKGYFTIRRERRFLILYTLVLLFSFSPFKAIALFMPIICLLGLIFFVQIRPRYHVAKYLLILSVYTAIGIAYFFMAPGMSFFNHFFFLVTISSVLFLFFDFSSIASEDLLRKSSSITMFILFFEALYGILQGVVGAIQSGSFDLANGDVVRGTIEPGFSVLGLGGNAMFAILVSALMLYVLSMLRSPLSLQRICICLMVIVVWVMASVLHTIIFFGGAFVFAIVLFKIPKKQVGSLKNIRKYRNMLIGFMILVAALLPIFFPSNIKSIPILLAHSLAFGEDSYSEKVVATFNTIILLPTDYPLQPLIGIGPGQYSSRASMILSGEYLGGTSLPFQSHIGGATKKYIMPMWTRLRSIVGKSSTFFPFYSWMSLYGEMGLAGLVVAGFWIIRTALRLRKYYSHKFPLMNLAMLVLLFYVAILGFQDNYWEFTQVMTPVFLIFSLCYSYLRSEYTSKREIASAHAESGSSFNKRTEC